MHIPLTPGRGGAVREPPPARTTDWLPAHRFKGTILMSAKQIQVDTGFFLIRGFVISAGNVDWIFPLHSVENRPKTGQIHFFSHFFPEIRTK